MGRAQEKGVKDYLFVIITGTVLLLFFEKLLDAIEFIHMYSILPTVFVTSGMIGWWLKRTGWTRYSHEFDNGVIIGLAIAVLYGFISIPLNFRRTDSDALLYILFSLGMTIASLFVLPVVLRMFIKRQKNIKAAKN